MYINQLSVFLGNNPGRLLYVCRLLGDAGIDIIAANIAESKDFGVLRLIVNDCQGALQVLKNASLSADCTKVLAVEVPDSPGGLANVLDAIGRAGLNIEYIYGFSKRHSDNAFMVFRFEDSESALDAIVASGLKVVSELR